MTTASRADQVLDQYKRPVPGALIYVYDLSGALASLTSDGTTAIANPLTSDAFGNYSYYTLVGYYREDIWYGGKLQWSENNILVGNLTPASVATPITPQERGAVGDGVTDDYQAFADAVASLGLDGELFIPPGRYRLSQTLKLTAGIKLRGAGFSENPGTINGVSYPLPTNYQGSILQFDQNVAGLQFIDFTDNNADSQAFEFQGSRYAVLQDIMLYGGGGTSTTAHGIEVRTVVTFNNVRIQNFAANGLLIDASVSGSVPYGNASKSRFDTVRCISNGMHGVKVMGTDANILTFVSLKAQLNGGWGYFDITTVGGNLLLGPHFATNNQSNGDGTPQETAVQADSSLLTTAANGSVSFKNASVTPHTVVGAYIEGGSGSKAHLSRGVTVIGGLLGQTGSQFLESTSLAIIIDGSGSLTLPEIGPSGTATPFVNHQSIFLDPADHKLKRKDSSGTVTIIA